MLSIKKWRIEKERKVYCSKHRNTPDDIIGKEYVFGLITVLCVESNKADNPWYMDSSTCEGCFFNNVEHDVCFGHGSYGDRYFCSLGSIRRQIIFGLPFKEKCCGFQFKQKQV